MVRIAIFCHVLAWKNYHCGALKTLEASRMPLLVDSLVEWAVECFLATIARPSLGILATTTITTATTCTTRFV